MKFRIISFSGDKFYCKMFSNRNKRKVHLNPTKSKKEEEKGPPIPEVILRNDSNIAMEFTDSDEVFSRSSASSDSPSPTNIAETKRFKWFSDARRPSRDSMDTSPSPVKLTKFKKDTSFDDFKKPFDCFAPSVEFINQGN